MRWLAALLLLTFGACKSGPPVPVDLESWDVCARCRMAISQKRYAAEFVDAGGTAAKFDDIACMLRYAADRRLASGDRAVFVMDYGTGRWLDARQAVYVQSRAIPSPMAGGVAAVAGRGQAEELARSFQGGILTFEELWNSK